MRTGTAIGTMAAALLAAAQSVVAAPRLEEDGVIGQSGRREDPISFSDCSLCVNDEAGNVLLTDGWRIPAGSMEPQRCKMPKAAEFLSDGQGLWQWDGRRLTRMTSAADGIVASQETYELGDVGRGKLFMAPPGLGKGFAARGRFFVLDRSARDVRVWIPAKRQFESVFRYGDRVEEAKKVCAAALHPTTGDLLLAFEWPVSQVRRYDVRGVEQIRGTWPQRVLAQRLVSVGRRVFAIGFSARELSDVPGGLAFGKDCTYVHGIARGTDGWWLGTSQGAQYYPDVMAGNPDETAARRVGGLVGVDALGLSGGRVLVCQAHRLQSVWLDDRPDEPLSSDRQWMREFTGSGGRVTSVEGVDDGAYLFRYEQKGKPEVWRFDPRKIWYGERKERLFRVTDGACPARPVNEASVGGFRAVAEDGVLKLFDGKRCVWQRKNGARLLAGEGDRLVAYVPEISGIVRFRLVK